MKKFKVSLVALTMLASFNVLAEDWDAMGNPNSPTVERPSGDMSGDWDAMGNSR